MEWIESVPAYGADYKTAKEVKAAWNSGKDFRDLSSGRYFSIRDSGFHVTVRYSRLMKVTVVR